MVGRRTPLLQRRYLLIMAAMQPLSLLLRCPSGQWRCPMHSQGLVCGIACYKACQYRRWLTFSASCSFPRCLTTQKVDSSGLPQATALLLALLPPALLGWRLLLQAHRCCHCCLCIAGAPSSARGPLLVLWRQPRRLETNSPTQAAHLEVGPTHVFAATPSCVG